MSSRLLREESSRAAAPLVAPVHLAIRFALELALLPALADWGWHLGGGNVVGVILAVALPVVAAALWAVFRTSGDTGEAHPTVPIPRVARLGLEFALIGLAAYGLWTSGSRAAAETLLTVFALHYAVTWPRVAWLIRQEQRGRGRAAIMPTLPHSEVVSDRQDR